MPRPQDPARFVRARWRMRHQRCHFRGRKRRQRPRQQPHLHPVAGLCLRRIRQRSLHHRLDKARTDLGQGDSRRCRRRLGPDPGPVALRQAVQLGLVVKWSLKRRQHLPPCGHLLRNEVLQPVLGLAVVAMAALRDIPACPGHPGPDCGLAGRPIDHNHGIKAAHSPSSVAMKSAMTCVSSRSNTGRSSSSAQSEATARMVGSPGAISGVSAAPR
ncbi:hypothetical protein TRIHO_00120 [Tritonibacter horizontis]|uniref:Uncharacterized protein n=1 Tax=Tritonibacter horizontis TaxID=1768241 RepID=A0A132C4J5_9RHOB|nr:hypothetical protein TRIHO_00120 [Tritonibacter horizontis]